jgi:hypothetical protein
MIETAERLQQLQAEFAAAGISTESPGFYDDFAFIRQERKDPTYVNNYARYVRWRDHGRGYDDHVEQVVHVVAAELQLAVHEDTSADAYAELPLVISRILEREGIWNYVVRGALNVTFPLGSGFEPASFWAVDVPSRMAHGGGYLWVCAPPYQVIDLSVGVLQYPCPVGHLVPRLILGNDSEECEGLAAELLSPAAMENIRDDGLSLEEGLDHLAPGFRSSFAPDFPAALIRHDETLFKYIPTGIITPEEELENLHRFTSKDRTAIQLYDHQIRPRLLKD